jgi:E3 ubiquitin-protein ligase RNF213
VVSVIDEIGLADRSPQNPLKLLHFELELTFDEAKNDKRRILIVALSNYNLDASKLNRFNLIQIPSADSDNLKKVS